MPQLTMEHSAKLASLGEMAGGVAHEINNPLAIISGYTQRLKILAKKSELSSDCVVSVADKINGTVKRIHSVVDGLRRLSRQEDSEKMENVAVSEIVDEAIALCSEKMRQRAESAKTFRVTFECIVGQCKFAR